MLPYEYTTQRRPTVQPQSLSATRMGVSPPARASWSINRPPTGGQIMSLGMLLLGAMVGDPPASTDEGAVGGREDVFDVEGF